MFADYKAPFWKLLRNSRTQIQIYSRLSSVFVRKQRERIWLTVMTDSVVLRSSDFALLSGGRVEWWKSEPCAESGFCSLNGINEMIQKMSVFQLRLLYHIKTLAWPWKQQKQYQTLAWATLRDCVPGTNTGVSGSIRRVFSMLFWKRKQLTF